MCGSLRRVAIVFAAITLLILTHTATAQTQLCFPENARVVVWYVNGSPQLIAGARPKYVVVDPDSGPYDTPWSAGDIEFLKSRGAKVLAYVNIGFAEDWRWYWNGSWGPDNHPPWLEWVEYPGWEGEYFVKFWHSSAWGPGGWVVVLKREIKRVMSMGFDGVFLDNVDAYTFWLEPELYNLTIPRADNATEYMIKLVDELSKYCKSINPACVVAVNIGGGVELLANETFLNAIDAVFREEVWYSVGEKVPPEETAEALKYLYIARDAGKDVIAIEYVANGSQGLDALTKAIRNGFYIVATTDYLLSTMPPSAPVYSTVAVADEFVVWAFREPFSNFTLYIGELCGDTVSETAEFQGAGGHIVASVYDPKTNTLYIAWAAPEDGKYVVKVAKVSAEVGKSENISTLTARIVSENAHPATPLAIAQVYDKLHVLYLDRELHLTHAVIDKETLEVTKLEELDNGPIRLVTAASTGSFAVAAWVNNNTLKIAFIDERGVELKKLCEGTDPWRLSAARYNETAVAILYVKQGKTHLLLASKESTRDYEINAPTPQPATPVATLNNYVAYCTDNGTVIYALSNKTYSIVHTRADAIAATDNALLAIRTSEKACGGIEATKLLELEKEKSQTGGTTTTPSNQTSQKQQQEQKEQTTYPTITTLPKSIIKGIAGAVAGIIILVTVLISKKTSKRSKTRHKQKISSRGGSSGV